MRACFLGQNVCALGYGVAMLQSPPLLDEETGKPADGPGKRDLPRALLAPSGAGTGATTGQKPANL